MGNPPPPEASVWPLWLLYLVFAIALPLLYAACRMRGQSIRRKGVKKRGLTPFLAVRREMGSDPIFQRRFFSRIVLVRSGVFQW
jgi:hypothetical protein